MWSRPLQAIEVSETGRYFEGTCFSPFLKIGTKMHFSSLGVFHQNQVSISTIWSVSVQVDQQLTSGHRQGYYQALLLCGS